MRTKTKTCQNCQKDFAIEPADFAFYEKVKVPAPSWCPECRLIRRMCFRNERNLYKRKCGLCSKQVISVFSPDKPYKVYCSPCWYSDRWEAQEFNLSYNANKYFFEQFKGLQLQVPLMGLIINSPTLINSDYNNHASHLKNCYLLFDADTNEDCYYSTSITFTKDSMDMLMVYNSSLCYGSVNIRKCYQTHFSQDCEDCHHIYFSKDLIGCSNCFACCNLRNQQYHIFNKPYSKENYLKEIVRYNLGSFSALLALKDKVHQHWNKFCRRYMHGRHNNDVSGDYITFSKNTEHSFYVIGCEDSKFCQRINIKSVKDAYDYFEWGNNANLIYECITVGEGASNVKFSYGCWRQGTMNVEYSIYCASCKDIFGCIGLRNKQYCILNKQYSRGQYYALREKIIQEMNKAPYKTNRGIVYRYGEFFPPELSFFSYNESTAGDEMPLTKEQALSQDYNWKDPEKRNYQITITNNQLADNIKDVPDSITNEIIQCATKGLKSDFKPAKPVSNCPTAFKIIPQELDFYRKMNLPLPRFCPNCRHYQRLQQRNPLRLWKRQCQCAGVQSSNGVYQNTAQHSHANNPCLNKFQSTYSPDRKEIVYCEKCYLAEVV